MSTCPSRAASLVAAVLLLALPAGEVNATNADAAPVPASQIDFSEVVARNGGAVVAISTRQIVTPELPNGISESLAERLREQGSSLMRPREARAIGSGFVVSAEGHIVTNNHVIEGATRIEVMLEDGSRFGAEIVGVDPLTDLAVLRIEPDPTAELVVASWGDSEALRPGAWTIAVGSPFGLGGTVTVGVLSAAQRDIRVGPYDEYLQTDAAINVGNSGGPLFNVEGDVVGVNTAIYSPTGASVGIGFAVPSSIARRVVDDLIETGAVRRGVIGASLQDLDDGLARAFGYELRRGALVGGVERDGPAERAGLRRGDVVVGFGETRIERARQLNHAIAETEPGAPVTLTYLRGGEEARVEVLVGREEPPELEPIPASLTEREEVRLGLSLRPLPEQMRRELGPDISGVIVQGVRPGGLGASSGLRRGDLILEAGLSPVTEPGDVTLAWESARDEDRPLLLQIQRGHDGLYVAIER